MSILAHTADSRPRFRTDVHALCGSFFPRAPGSSCDAEIGGGVKIVSVMTTDSSGGAEFAAVEMLDALRQRGHETVMVTDVPAMARDTEVRVAPVSLGAEAVHHELGEPRAALAVAAHAPARARFARRRPYDVLMVHYKKEQLLARHAPRSAAQHARVGGVGTGAVPAAARHPPPRLPAGGRSRRRS